MRRVSGQVPPPESTTKAWITKSLRRHPGCAAAPQHQGGTMGPRITCTDHRAAMVRPGVDDVGFGCDSRVGCGCEVGLEVEAGGDEIVFGG